MTDGLIHKCGYVKAIDPTILFNFILNMAFLGDKDIIQFAGIPDKEWIKPFKKERIENASYELAVGNEAYRTDGKDRKIEILDDKNVAVEINPGQFALLLTDEEINMPNDTLAFISIKASIKLRGLVNVSGFHVDPGFKGKLMFSVYNAGPSTITLKKGQRCFLIWFSSLKTALTEKEAYNSDRNHHQNQASISTSYIDALKAGDMTSPNTLLKLINENKDSLTRLFWAVGILIGLAITIEVNNYFKNTAYIDGYNNRLKEEHLQTTIDSIIQYRLDSIIQNKLDSIQAKQNDTAKAEK